MSKETFIVDLENKDRNSIGDIDAASPVSFLEYDNTIPSKFMLGTDSGKILCCSRKAHSQCDTIISRFKVKPGLKMGSISK